MKPSAIFNCWHYTGLSTKSERTNTDAGHGDDDSSAPLDELMKQTATKIITADKFIGFIDNRETFDKMTDQEMNDLI